jgi:hypothetical protein
VEGNRVKKPTLAAAIRASIAARIHGGRGRHPGDMTADEMIAGKDS